MFYSGFFEKYSMCLLHLPSGFSKKEEKKNIFIKKSRATTQYY